LRLHLRNFLLSAAAVVLLGALLAALYWAGLQGGFFFDDEPSILQAEGVRLERLALEELGEALASGRSGPSGRPVAQLSFALNHYLSGFDPFAFKATNLAIHAVCGLLIFWLASRLFAAASPGIPARRRALLSGLLSALWLLHPIQLTPVLHVVQRMTSLSALFLLAALLLHIAGRERGGRTGWAALLLGWGVCWPLSFLSKESGVLFPLFALAWECILRRQATGGLDRFARLFAALGGLTFAGGIAYAFSPFGQWLWVGYDYRGFTLGERLLTEGRVLWFYLSLILLPRLEAFGLYHDDIAVSTGFLSPWTTLTAWAGLGGLAWLAWRVRAKSPLISLGIAWFLAGHLLESTALPLELAHEHRNYLPSLGILLALTAGIAHLVERPGPFRLLGVTVAAAALIYLPFVTALRAHQFGNEILRTQIEAQHHRGSARAQYEAGRALASQADAMRPETPIHAFARAHFERAGELDPAFKLGWLGLLYLNCRAGLGVEPAWIEAFARALGSPPFGPGDSTALLSLKDLALSHDSCIGRGMVERLFGAAHANPSVPLHARADLHAWLADYLVLRARDLPAARAELDRALALAPYNPGNRLRLVQLDLLQGRFGDAALHLADVEKLPLKRSEGRMLAALRACLDNRATGASCTIE